MLHKQLVKRRDGENIYKCVYDVAGYHCKACKCVMNNKGLQKPQKKTFEVKKEKYRKKTRAEKPNLSYHIVPSSSIKKERKKEMQFN